MSEPRVTTLDNGLRIATDPMASVASASVGVWVATGSRCESAEESGLSHLLEHMVFKGTERRDARAIAEEIEAVGGHLNAHTSREYTAFYAKVLQDDVAVALDVVADIVRNATLDAEELERERTVVIQEILQALDTPDDIVFDNFQETAFPSQALGRPVLGAQERIASFDAATLRAYRDRHYRAGGMVVAASGAIDHDAVVDLAAAAFGSLPAGESAAGESARYRGGDHREEQDLEQVHLVLGFEGLGYRDPDFHALSVLSTVLGGGMSSRLFQEAREKRGLVYSIYSFPASYSDAGLFGIYAGSGESEVEELVPLICNELRSAARTIGDEEVTRARAQLRAGLLMSLESSTARCEQLARQMMVFGRPIPVAETVARIEAVEASHVRAAALRLLGLPPTFAAVGPIGRVPPYEDIAAAL